MSKQFITKIEKYKEAPKKKQPEFHHFILVYFDNSLKLSLEYQSCDELGGNSTLSWPSRMGRKMTLLHSKSCLIRLTDLQKMSKQFVKERDYNLMSHNCQHFCNMIWKNVE